MTAARDDVPEGVRDMVIEHAEAGEHITLAAAKQMVVDAEDRVREALKDVVAEARRGSASGSSATRF